MHVTRLRLTNFRNYAALDLALPPGLVVLWGENAQGKTNLLEALFYLSTSRSPRTSRDAELIGWHTPEGEARFMRAEAAVQRRDRTVTLDITVMPRGGDAPTTAPAASDDAEVFVAAAPGALKRIRVNGVPRRAIDLLGNAPVVFFRPEDVELVTGAPAVRRRSIDILISQLDPRYPRALQRYGRAVTQRNALLRRIAERAATVDHLGPWDDLLVRDGAYLLHERLRVVAALSEIAATAHEQLSGARDRLAMAYVPTACQASTEPAEAQIGEAFLQALASARHRDLALGQTTVGPHRDDVALLVNRAPAADYASRGQQRTIALAWRLAEAEYLRTASQEPPIVLLDDVLSELDPRRRSAVLRAMAAFDQVILTATEAVADAGTLHPAATFEVRHGTVMADDTAST